MSTETTDTAAPETPVADVAVTDGKADKKPEAKKVDKKPEPKKAVKPTAKSTIGKATESDQTWLIPLARIVKTENPREEPAVLASLGYSLINGDDKEHSLLHMALSDDMETVKAFVELVEEHEGETEGKFAGDEPSADLSNVQYKEPSKSKARSIVSLAHSIVERQLEPVAVRRGSKTKDGGYNYNLLFGQRRVAALAYAYAKAKTDKEEGVKDSPFKKAEPMVVAFEVKVNEDEAFEMAVAENMERKDFTPTQEGHIYLAYTQRQNPETGKKWNLKDIAKHLFGEDKSKYGHVRNRWALVVPYKADEVDDKGNVTKKGRGLTDEERAALDRGEKTLTWAIRKALREEHYNPEGSPQKKRTHCIPLKEVQKAFDNADESDERYRAGLAFAMGLTLKQAAKESDKRIETADKKDTRKAEKEAKKAGKGKKVVSDEE